MGRCRLRQEERRKTNIKWEQRKQKGKASVQACTVQVAGEGALAQMDRSGDKVVQQPRAGDPNWVLGVCSQPATSYVPVCKAAALTRQCKVDSPCSHVQEAPQQHQGAQAVHLAQQYLHLGFRV